MRIRALVVVAVVVVGCKKEKGPPPAPAPKAPVSTGEQDALWKLAPDGTVAGIVLSSRGVASLESGWLAVRSLITTAPELAPAAAAMEQQLTKIFGSSNVKLADVGMAPGKGAALFGLEKGAEVAIIPVVDRDKFLAVTKGTKGTDHDTITDHVCRTVQNVYACAKPPELLDRLGKAPMGDALKLAGARGDIEVAGTIPDANHPVTFAAVGQIDRGAIVVRGAVKGVPDTVTSKLKAIGKQTVDASKASGFAVLNLVPVLADANIQSATTPSVVPGVTVTDLITNVDGPVTVSIPNGAMVFDVRIPMKDTGPAQKLVEQCDQSPYLQMLGPKVENGVCHVPVPQMQMQLDAWVEGKELRLGKKGAPAPAAVPPTAIASELATGEWAVTMFGRGTLLGEGQFPAMPMGALPDEAKMGLRIMMFLNEVGLGVRADGDTVRFLASVRTAWSNPDDVVAKIIAITPDQVVTGTAAAAAKNIATGAPTSPFAGDFKAGLGGIMIPAASVGILAAVAIPAYMDYMKKSKSTEATVELERLDGRVKWAIQSQGELPKGKVGPTPAKPCCEQPGAKCNDPAAWKNKIWKELDFAIEEPHLFRYTYESDDGLSFVATATGDLDCDGIEVTYTLSGKVESSGGLETTMTPPTNRD